MDRITALQAAEKWNLSLRTVQNLCRQNKIFGAERWGNAWMLPADAERPVDGRSKAGKAAKAKLEDARPFVRKSPFLNMTDLYSRPGTADKVAESLAYYPEAQALFRAEIAYSRGEIDKVIEHAGEFLHSCSDFYSVNAGGMLLALCAMWKGDIYLWREAKKHIFEAPTKTPIDKEIMGISIACVDSAVRDLSSYPYWFTRGQFGHLPSDAHPAAKVFYIKYLLVYAQDMAKSQFALPDVTGLGLMKTIPYIVEPMIVQAQVDRTVIPEIYLHLLAAIAYHQCGDEPDAIRHIDKAIELALPDNLLGILAEHRRQFDNLLDDRLMLADTNACRRYRELHRGFLEGWTKLHNSLLSKSVNNSFTIREREVARYAAFGLSNAEIAQRLNISVSATKKCVYAAMNKAGCHKREELGAFV